MLHGSRAGYFSGRACGMLRSRQEGKHPLELSAAEENFKSRIDERRYKFLLQLESCVPGKHFNPTQNNHRGIFNGRCIQKKAIANVVRRILDDLSDCRHCTCIIPT